MFNFSGSIFYMSANMHLGPTLALVLHFNGRKPSTIKKESGDLNPHPLLLENCDTVNCDAQADWRCLARYISVLR